LVMAEKMSARICTRGLEVLLYRFCCCRRKYRGASGTLPDHRTVRLRGIRAAQIDGHPPRSRLLGRDQIQPPPDRMRSLLHVDPGGELVAPREAAAQIVPPPPSDIVQCSHSASQPMLATHRGRNPPRTGKNCVRKGNGRRGAGVGEEKNLTSASERVLPS